MRLIIAGTILALSVATASAQSTAPKITGNKSFCLKNTDKVDCSFDTMAACQKGMQTMAKDGSSGGSCGSRSEAR